MKRKRSNWASRRSEARNGSNWDKKVIEGVDVREEEGRQVVRTEGRQRAQGHAASVREDRCSGPRMEARRKEALHSTKLPCYNTRICYLASWVITWNISQKKVESKNTVRNFGQFSRHDLSKPDLFVWTRYLNSWNLYLFPVFQLKLNRLPW